MEKIYNPSAIEQKNYQEWEEKGYFKPHGDTDKESFLHHDPATKCHW